MTTTNTQAHDEAEIQQLIADWTRALCAKDLDRLMSHYAPDVTVFDVIPPFQTRGAAALRRTWEGAFPCLPAAFQTETRDLGVIVSGEVALAHWLWRFTGSEQDHPAMQTWFRATVGYQRQQGRWRIVHEHASVPFHPETSRAALTLDLGSETGNARNAVHLTRLFDAPPALVFQAWTEPEHLGRWCCPRGFKVISGEGDLRPGGAWRCVMQSPEGAEHAVRGVYREIVTPKRLVFTHAWEEDAAGELGPETLVTVTFAKEAEKTRITFDQGVFATAESRDNHADGWSETLDNLTAYLAEISNPILPSTEEVSSRELVLTRLINAPRTRVFQAWTDPAQLAQWWGPHGMTVPVCEMEVKPGGVFRTVMRAPDGTEYPNEGFFVEVAEPERLAFTDKLEANGKPSREAFMLATATFEEQDGKTKLTARALHYSDADREKHERMGFHKGWGEMLERLETHVAKA